MAGSPRSTHAGSAASPPRRCAPSAADTRNRGQRRSGCGAASLNDARLMAPLIGLLRLSRAEVGYRLKCVKAGRCLDFDVQHRADSAEAPVEADQLQDLHDLAGRVEALHGRKAPRAYPRSVQHVGHEPDQHVFGVGQGGRVEGAIPDGLPQSGFYACGSRDRNVLLVLELTSTLGGNTEDDQLAYTLGQFQSAELDMGQPQKLLSEHR